MRPHHVDMTPLCHCQTPGNAPDLPHVGMGMDLQVIEMDDAQNARMAPPGHQTPPGCRGSSARLKQGSHSSNVSLGQGMIPRGPM